MSYYSANFFRKKTKKKAEIEHSKERALEQFGIELTPDLRAQIISAIRKRKPTARLFKKQSNRVWVWDVKIGNNPKMRVVYDRLRKEIVTVF